MIPLRPQRAQVLLRVLFAGTLVALGVLLMTGAASGQAKQPPVALTSSSSLLAAPSPATTIASTPTTAPATTPTTIPTVHTGEAWASGWFFLLLALTVLVGAACLRPMIARRRSPAPAD